MINIDFALTERIGRFQLGVAGFYAVQVEDDKLFGVPIPPDEARAETAQLGGVVAYDMPEPASTLKVKALTSLFAINTITAWGVILGWVKKF